jgi:Toprim domain
MIDPATLLGRLGIEAAPRGGKLHATCPHPDHDDRKPSWAAWQDDLGRFRHRCLSCGFGGGPAGLVMAVLGCDRRQAHDFLDGTEQAGPPPALQVRVEVREWPFRRDALPVPDEVWLEPLAQWPTPARAYLERRRLGQREVARWGLGYAVDGYLAGRVWIPVRDRACRMQSWTARAFGGGEPKYDSSTTPAPHVLFGEHLWPTSYPDVVVLVEGPFDAMAVEAACPNTAVAALRGSASGAALDPGHAALLARFREVVVATDPDAAGDRAAAHASGIGRWTSVRRAKLEKGVDPAKLYELEGPDALRLVLGFRDAPTESRLSVEGCG